MPSKRFQVGEISELETLRARSLLTSSQADLAQAEAELANHVGALARFVVRNAAAKARNEQELHSLLANEIDDPAEKQSFLKRLASAGRRA